MTMTLHEKQRLFPILVARFIPEVIDLGYEITFGEFWRPDETAALYEKLGKGIKKSNHRLRIAMDLNIFKDGIWLTRTESIKPLGEIWEGMKGEGYLTVWGGRFITLPDGGHFGIEHEGIR